MSHAKYRSVKFNNFSFYNNKVMLLFAYETDKHLSFVDNKNVIVLTFFYIGQSENCTDRDCGTSLLALM